jgi:hypothetical protein
MEALRLRVQDLDFAGHQLMIRGGKGNKDRVTVLPQNLIEPLQIHLHEISDCIDKILLSAGGRCVDAAEHLDAFALQVVEIQFLMDEAAVKSLIIIGGGYDLKYPIPLFSIV